LAARASEILRRASALAITLLTTLAAHFQCGERCAGDMLWKRRRMGGPLRAGFSVRSTQSSIRWTSSSAGLAAIATDDTQTR